MNSLSIGSATIPGKLETKLQAISAAGFSAVDLLEADFTGYDGTAIDLGTLAKQCNLKIHSLKPFRNLEGLSGKQRNNAFKRLNAKLKLTKQLGGDLLILHASVHPESSTDTDLIKRDLRKAAELAAGNDIRIAYLALSWSSAVKTDKQAIKLVKEINHAHLGIALDSFQSCSNSKDLSYISDLAAEKIFFVQMSDTPAIEMDSRVKSRHFQLLPGLGNLDLKQFIECIVATGYRDYWSLEVFNDKLRESIAQSVARDAYRSLVNLLDLTSRQLNTTITNLPEMPDRIAVKKIEFLEFTASEDDLSRLSESLSQLGFQYSGRHITKSVDLWQQGNVKIVVNSERIGFANSAHLMHGASVCAIGLEVDDADSTWLRAKALGAAEFKQSVASGEVILPAIRGVGGSVLHFIDNHSRLGDIWKNEFVGPTAVKNRTDVGIKRIDHIAQPINHEEMQNWALFYLSTLQVNLNPIVDITDPSGLIHSQSIESQDGGLRLNLNGVNTHRTNAGAFLADHLGAPVQHIAFGCNDIFSTSSLLEKSGVPRLQISANYYNDLQVCFDLEDGFVDQLQSANILYDREHDSEFFQIFSQPLFDGFFFEIVERRNRYSGYGARNAPYRLAAMSRHKRPFGVPLR